MELYGSAIVSPLFTYIRHALRSFKIGHFSSFIGQERLGHVRTMKNAREKREKTTVFQLNMQILDVFVAVGSLVSLVAKYLYNLWHLSSLKQKRIIERSSNIHRNPRVISPTNNNRSKQCEEPIRIPRYLI